MDVIDRKMTLLEAFKVVDSVLGQAVGGIADIITTAGLVNVDFADVKTIMKDAGSALLGIGTGVGENRAQMAARAAVNSPLLDLSIEGARGVLFNIAGGEDLTMFEVDEAAHIISSAADPDANVIFGAVIKSDLVDQVKITVIATGFDETRSRIAQMRTNPVRPAIQGVVSEPVLTRPTYDDNNNDDGDKYNPPEDSGSDDGDTFGDKFEIPAFLRKIR
jgi:cell division protein FtsZ